MFFLEFSCSFYDPTDVDNLISGFSASSKFSLYIWKFSNYILLKPSLKDVEHYLASMWNECNCTVVWAFFDIALFWDWNESWPFPVPWPLLSFSNLLVYWVVRLPLLSQSPPQPVWVFAGSQVTKDCTRDIFHTPPGAGDQPRSFQSDYPVADISQNEQA